MTDIAVRDTELVPLDAVKPHPRNARRGDLDTIAESLQRNGQYRSIVANRRTGHVLAGNHTLQAAQRLGWQHILVSWIDVDPDAELRILLVDNRSNDLAGYDEELLAQLVHEAQTAGGGDLAGTGYDQTSLDELDKLVQQAQDAGADTDPDAPPADPVTRPGDLWTLGEHRLYCGDSRDAGAIAQALGGDLADMLWTDPPYGVDVAASAKARHGLAYPDMAGDETGDPAQTAALATAVLANACARTREGGSAYVCHADTLGLEFRAAFVQAGWRLAQVLIWIKPSIVIGRQDYQWMHEPILYGWKPGAGHTFYGDRADPTVIDRAVLLEQLQAMEHVDLARMTHRLMTGGPGTVIRADRPHDVTDHPTPKPIEVIAGHVRNSCPPAGTVLDPFAGSGSTLIACQNLGARARLVEISPAYCDVIVDRFQRHTGLTATRSQP